MDCGPLQVASTEKKEEANYLLRRNQELCRRQREINREQAWLVGEEERAKESKPPPRAMAEVHDVSFSSPSPSPRGEKKEGKKENRERKQKQKIMH